MQNPTFDCDGPLPAVVEMLRAKDEKDATTNYRITSVWNGKMKDRRAMLSISLSADVGLPNCVLRCQYDDVTELDDARNMQRFILGLLKICPNADEIEVGPLKYYTDHKVFPKRPGAGWMLYLAKTIAASELPEAAELVPVTRDGEQKGTIIVSVADEVLSIDNPYHLEIANSIEIRLADQDILPR